MSALGRKSNFHGVCKVYLKRGTLSPLFDSYSRVAARIVSEMIIFFAWATHLSAITLLLCDQNMRIGDALRRVAEV